MKKIIIFDWNSLVNRYSNRSFSFKTMSFITTVIKLFKIVKYNRKDEVFIVDDDHSTWRRSFNKKYKTKSEITLQKSNYFNTAKIWRVLDEALTWNFIRIKQAEALDIISILIKNNQDKGIVLISSSREAEQFFKYNNVKIFSVVSKKFKKQIKYNSAKFLLKADNIEEALIYDLISIPEFIEITINKNLNLITKKELNLKYINNVEIENKFKEILNAQI